MDTHAVVTWTGRALFCLCTVDDQVVIPPFITLGNVLRGYVC